MNEYTLRHLPPRSVLLTASPWEAVRVWSHDPAHVILTEGTGYAIGLAPQVTTGRESWRPTCPEALEALPLYQAEAEASAQRSLTQQRTRDSLFDNCRS